MLLTCRSMTATNSERFSWQVQWRISVEVSVKCPTKLGLGVTVLKKKFDRFLFDRQLWSVSLNRVSAKPFESGWTMENFDWNTALNECSYSTLFIRNWTERAFHLGFLFNEMTEGVMGIENDTCYFYWKKYILFMLAVFSERKQSASLIRIGLVLFRGLIQSSASIDDGELNTPVFLIHPFFA